MAIWGYFYKYVIAMYLIYYQLYFLSTCLLQLKYDQYNYHCYELQSGMRYYFKGALLMNNYLGD